MRGRREDMALQQQEDVAAVGLLMVHLAGAAGGGPALQALTGHLSPHLMHLLASLQNNHIRDCHTVSIAEGGTRELVCMEVPIVALVAMSVQDCIHDLECCERVLDGQRTEACMVLC